MVALPADRPVVTPLEFTLATALALDIQLTDPEMSPVVESE